ncbi:protein rapunzel-like isoform X2 [Myxocyprinus asiaticus]|uniref:protein rapunzel-like isoform X2 n=1 Tax=Myxocyprinus asiaticus TaxID=70543 RepID=UPI0022219336|nr:protein rapunzel-like isoform X2 [Myxocyprinus asiaticus]XP_051577969.1 protein rapunzel-like isoform X2 [Myxocyprinus asiaticus]XP_051577970.1 protein rapunzel-like isoform X2 [Myxocyprinus asiaticus]XP_051577971.1 protein rapunzel-like isoform X2 [Myxocyprinus asiaticus]XP_051577972.1 protein rapunzel-like isoform X2 [Myxocyprinus asiaticus]XP_051577973.1 protein rapunzel-like isoform X2 [Myxocyprinus asiaticus]XP_051577974.1 protein rapunzel-like isoform X2 [Myxocyprinus asiaticus]
MAEQLQKLVAQKKDTVETVMEVFEQGAEVVASIAGDLFPVFSIAAPIVKLALDNVESKEAVYMKEQFQKVRDRLEVVSEEIQQINEEIKKSGIDATYFSVEENMTNQFRKFMDVLNAKPKFREVRKNEFLKHFARVDGDKNLHILYNAITGDNFSGESVLEIILNYEQKSRRVVEDFCARLKKLFCIGLIAFLGYTALKGDDDEKVLQQWNENMKVVQSKMNVVIEDCINSFPAQAEMDSKRIVRDHSDKSNQQLADMIVEHYKKKYDWVCWSVRIFNSPTGLFTNKKDFQCLAGKSRFQVQASDEKLNVVISYSSSPEPIDKARIQNLISEQKNPKVIAVTEQLFETIPLCVVHTVKTSCKDMGFSCSFSDELHYYKEFKNFYVFLHSA